MCHNCKSMDQCRIEREKGCILWSEISLCCNRCETRGIPIIPAIKNVMKRNNSGHVVFDEEEDATEIGQQQENETCDKKRWENSKRCLPPGFHKSTPCLTCRRRFF